MIHLPRRVCCCKNAEAQRSAMDEASERQAVQAREMAAVRMMDPHVTPHIAEVAADRAAIM